MKKLVELSSGWVSKQTFFSFETPPVGNWTNFISAKSPKLLWQSVAELLQKPHLKNCLSRWSWCVHPFKTVLTNSCNWSETRITARVNFAFFRDQLDNSASKIVPSRSCSLSDKNLFSIYSFNVFNVKVVF